MAYDAKAGLKEVFNRLLTLPLPMAIDPFITATQNLDVIALGLVQAKVGQTRLELRLQDPASTREGRQQQRDRRAAVARILSALNRVKQDRRRAERKEEEDGWDPFWAEFQLRDPLKIGVRNRLVAEAAPGGLVGAAEIVLPRFAGGGTVTAPVTAGRIDFVLGLGRHPDSLALRIADLELQLEPFELAPGLSAGPGLIELRPRRRQSGTFEPSSGTFHVFFEGQITNDLYGPAEPIVIFVHAFGAILGDTCQVSVQADDPMIVPRQPGDRLERQPSISFAHRMSWDRRNRRLTFGPHIAARSGPTAGSVRFIDGSRVDDPLIGQPVRIKPLVATSVSPRRVEFAPTEIVVGSGPTDRLAGRLVGAALDVDTATFEGAVGWSDISPDLSRAVADLEQAPFFRADLSTAVGVIDLAAATYGFTRTAWNPFLDLGHVIGDA